MSSPEELALYKNFRAMCHDIRTPLNSVLGYAVMIEECLDDPDPKEDILDCAQNIQKAVDRIVDTLNKVRKLSEISIEKTKLNPVETDLNDLLDDVVSQTRPGTDFKIRRVEGISLFVDIELIKLALAEVLEIVVHNSPPESAVLVTCEEKQSNVSIFVENQTTPSDIREENKYAKPSTKTGEKPGCDLGINIAKGVVDLHGGEFMIESPSESAVKIGFSIPVRQIA